MTPEEFIAKWRGVTRTERSAAHEHFLDLCALLEVPKPADIDKHGVEYTFEKSTKKIGGRQGFADVWKNHCFAWEYKRDRRSLVEAYAQLKQYADTLDNPKLLIVSDMQEIRIHTNFTDTVAQQHVIPLAELRSVEARRLLRHCFLDPDRLRPTETRESVTAKAAANFARITIRLRQQQYDERRVAHFINKLVFCLFAEDIDLLPDRIFAEILDEAATNHELLTPALKDLFAAMSKRGGRFGAKVIRWFNGGLFDDDDVLELGIGSVPDLIEAARLDWSKIDPTIFGTLFESGLDEKKRAEMASLIDQPHLEAQHQGRLFDRSAPDKGVGIHYTDPGTIMKIIEPVVMQPLRAEWDGVKAHIAEMMERRAKTKASAEKTRLLNEARTNYTSFRKRLGAFRVLDPACGSGNFLALTLGALKDFDLAVMNDAKALDLPPDGQRVTPDAVLGIEINPYAAELARLTVWITELQWQLRNGVGITRVPILGKLDAIACRDALVTRDGKEASWPRSDVIIGNPPFLGGKLMRKSLTDPYVDSLFTVYKGRVPPEADLVTYWFAKAWECIDTGNLDRAGLVATNSIRGGANRRVLDRIAEEGEIFDAWDDEEWVIKGAAVRVSLVCFARTRGGLPTRLNGKGVEQINSDLTASRTDFTTARPLAHNAGIVFMGDTKGGAFDVDGALARKWLALPLNPNGRPNSDVLRPWVNGLDVTRRLADKWIVDFGWDMDERAASLYEAPFKYCEQSVKPEREKNRRENYRDFWWRHVEPRPGMWRAIRGLTRYIATPRVAKHRVFIWLHQKVVPDSRLFVFARDDDFFFGVLHSRFHEIWTLHTCSWHGVGNDPTYNGESVFGTFPFPDGLTPDILPASYAKNGNVMGVASASKYLHELRQARLNPPDLVKIEPEVVAGYPDRILARDAKAADDLKKLTLTNLYNERPTWLANAHRDLDAGVAAAYGWPADISDEDALARLLALNHARSGDAKKLSSRKAKTVA